MKWARCLSKRETELIATKTLTCGGVHCLLGLTSLGPASWLVISLQPEEEERITSRRKEGWVVSEVLLRVCPEMEGVGVLEESAQENSGNQSVFGWPGIKTCW